MEKNLYLAFLRGINIGGHRKIIMADLKVMLKDIGLEKVETYIQSGNVLFETNAQTPISGLENRIRTGIEDHFGHQVPTIVRSADQFLADLKNNPFLQNADNPPIEELHWTLLSAVPPLARVQNLPQWPEREDAFQVQGLNIFLRIPGKYHKTKYGNTFFEKNLGVSATTRNWKTVLKLADLISRR